MAAPAHRRAFRTAFVIRDHRHVLAVLPQRLEVQLRAGIFANGEVFPVVLLLRLHHLPYRTWFNSYQESTAMALAALAVQPWLGVWLVSTAETCSHVLTIRNTTAPFFRAALHTLADAPLWNVWAFAHTQAVLLDRYPTPEGMWNALNQVRFAPRRSTRSPEALPPPLDARKYR